MKRPSLFLSSFAFLLMLGGCSVLMPAPVNIGDSEAELLSKRGQPTNHYQDGNSQLFEYATGPWGQKTYMARIDANGKVVSFEQVLTVEKFAAIKVGEATKDTVLRTVGTPFETTYLPLRDLEVWSYAYKEHDVWNSVMHVHFDRNGVVRQMLNGPDLRFDPDSRFPFGMLRR